MLPFALPFFLVFGCTQNPTTAMPAPIALQFSEQTRTAGIYFSHFNSARGDYFYMETFGAGAAFLDYNSDGWQDLYLVNGADLYDSTGTATGPLNQLYRNLGNGRFDSAPRSDAADPGYGMGVSAADIDNDGDPDLYVTNYGPNRLLENKNGLFKDITGQARVGDDRWGTGAGFLDYDSDGDLDLFGVNYVVINPQEHIICRQGTLRSYCEPSVYAPTNDVLYRNDGTRFTDVTAQAGTTLKGRGLGVAFADYDNDGDTDIYVANDGTMNFLYQNLGGTFVETGVQAGARFNGDGRAEAGMGVDSGDFDNDSDPDLFVTNFAFETNTLYTNDGYGQFTDSTDRLGLQEPSYKPLGFGTGFIDADNDGWLDLFVANGHVMDVVAQYDSSQTYAQRNQLLHNTHGRFTDISDRLGPAFQIANVGRGTAFADYDNDGDQDLLVTVVAGRPRLLRNDGGNQHHWLQLRLIGHPQRDALGARVEVTAGNLTQTRERQSGRSYLSSHDSRLHFGLGKATQADIAVRWPDGTVQILKGIAANQLLVVEQIAKDTRP